MTRPPLLDQITAAASSQSMFVTGGTVVVAVSGGPDSVAMLHGLWSLGPELDITLAAAHFEHGVRGEESLADAEYVTALCTALGVPLQIEHQNIPAVAQSRGVSVQAAAREERHRFLREVAASVCAAGDERIAIGHTADDRAETILLNVLRGAGPDGLAAMPPVRLPIVRPLIDVSRLDTETYCRDAGLNPRTDSSNRKLDYTRNRVRAELLPYLSAYYNKGVRDALLRLGKLAAEDSSALNSLAEELFCAASTPCSPDELRLDASVISAAPRALQRRAVRIAIGTMRGHLVDIDLAAIDAILDGLRSERVSERTLASGGGGGFRVASSAAAVEIRRQVPVDPLPDWSVDLPIPGTTSLPIRDWQVTADRISVLNMPDVHFDDAGCVYLYRAEDIGNKLIIRTWKSGDKMRPKGMAGTKKLQDLYTDCKIRSKDRHLWPVLTAQLEGAALSATKSHPDTDTNSPQNWGAGGAHPILAVLGLRADERALSAQELDQLRQSAPHTEIVLVRKCEASP